MNDDVSSGRPSFAGALTTLALAAAMLAGCGNAREQPGTQRQPVVSAASLSCGADPGGTTRPGDSDSGSLIVDLGTSPQTQGNALKPYGLVYDLVKNLKVPVLWAYSTGKASSSAVDFSVDGRSFRGSSFIIPAAFVSTAQATVSKWVAQGVQVYGPTKTAFTPPTYFKRLTGFPNIVLDPQNGAVAQGYLTAAGFPIFPVQYPGTLNACQDMFVLPHADPTWALHGNLKSFVSNGGFLWVGCHAVSVLEAIDGNGDGVPDLDFLSTTAWRSGRSSFFQPVRARPTRAKATCASHRARRSRGNRACSFMRQGWACCSANHAPSAVASSAVTSSLAARWACAWRTTSC